MYKRIILPVICVLLIVSCGELKENEGQDPREYLKTAVDLNKCAIDVENISLEENDKSVISFPYNIIVTERNIIISSKGCPVKIFAKNGKYLRDAGRIGDGPGEYRDIPRLININVNTFGIYDPNDKRFMLYDINGKHKTTQKIKLKSIGVNGTILFYGNHYYFQMAYTKDVPYHLAVLDTNMNVVKYLIDADPQYAGYAARGYFTGDLFIDNQKGILHEVNSLSDNIINIMEVNNYNTRKIEVRGIKFHEKKPIKTDNVDFETMNKLYHSTDNMAKIYPYKDIYFISYTVPYKGHNILISVAFNPSTGKSKIIKNLPYDYFDGNSFYKLNIQTGTTKDNSEIGQTLKKCSYNLDEIRKYIN